MRNCLAYIALAIVLPTHLYAQEIPAAANAIFQELVTDEAVRANLVSQWASSDLNDVIADWSQSQQRAISDEARGVLVAEALVAESETQASGSNDIHQS